MKTKQKILYTCQACGAQRPRWEGRCHECGGWNTLVEEAVSSFSSSSHATKGLHRGWTNSSSSSNKPVSLNSSFTEQTLMRFATEIPELDRVLGGGLVEGSFVLLGGAPGIGKSTLSLQMAASLAQKNIEVLYVSGEESTAQTGSRAHRLGIQNEHIKLLSENNLHDILNWVQKETPRVVFIDSIQTVFLPDLPGAPGTVSQVRECANSLLTLSKGQNISVILIGHITKDGHIAGPKVLEHMVDTVLSFEGDNSQNFRLLRGLKNRFGGTNELGVFTMNEKGLKDVLNPSEIFLEQRGSQVKGSSVFPSMEGSRPLLCEIQALTVKTYLPSPRRTTVGFEIQRLHMIVAVLEKHFGLSLSTEDIYINIVGGLEVQEPAADLAVITSLCSTFGNFNIPHDMCCFGEVGLTGEIRAVTFAALRIKEAMKLGFKTIVLPTSNKKHLEENLSKTPEIQFIFVQDLFEFKRIPFKKL
jgi:DNA repair protein RadA/Sms